jgi:glycerol-1-phosphate dehydrogenase [NAD(P)+]
MPDNIPVYIGKDTIAQLLDYCRAKHFAQFVLVCDQNTYPVLGRAVEKALKGQGYDVICARLTGKEIIADERYIMQVFFQLDEQPRTFLAVGSGTLTDITRFVSHRVRAPFISLPTAASVDGFTSIVAPLVAGGLKKSYVTQPPIAVFADLPTLCAAPALLRASGFGDMVGKLTSIADWKLGHVLWDEPFDPAVERRYRETTMNCMRLARGIGEGTPESLHALIAGLIESGFCMLDFGNSNPASGAEHHISHFWEMLLLRTGRPAVFHGVKVGIGSIISAGWYAAIREFSQEDVSRVLQKATFRPPVAELANIRKALGEGADEMLDEQKEFIEMPIDRLEQLKKRILARWDEVLEIALSVPSPSQVKSWLQAAGAPLSAQEIGFGAEEERLALDYSHYLRKRFTINKLRQFLQIP